MSSPDDWRTTFIEAVENEQEPFTPWSPGRPVSEPTVAEIARTAVAFGLLRDQARAFGPASDVP